MKTKRKPKPRRTLHFTVRRALLIDHRTGEVEREPVGVLAPRDGLQRRWMRERKYHVGDELKADVRKDRGYQQLKVAHGLALMCIEQLDRFAEFGKDAHGALKALQRESGLACEVRQIHARPVVDALLAAAAQITEADTLRTLREVLGGIDKIDVTEARSMAYYELDAGEFNELFVGLCNHVLRTYWPDLDEEEGRAKIMKWIGESA